MSKKYELDMEDFKDLEGGERVYRITASKDFSTDFGDVKAGDKGGYVQSESNLSQEYSCWLFDDAMAFGGAVVEDDALLHNQSKAYGEAVVSDHAEMFDYSQAFDNATITNCAEMHDNSKAYGFTNVCEYSSMKDNAQAYENSVLAGDAALSGNDELKGDVHLLEQACDVAEPEKSR